MYMKNMIVPVGLAIPITMRDTMNAQNAGEKADTRPATTMSSVDK